MYTIRVLAHQERSDASKATMPTHIKRISAEPIKFCVLIVSHTQDERLKVAPHLFRSDRNRRVRTEQKCLKEIEYTLFYLTAHTSSDQTGTDASDHIRTEAEFFERYFF